MVYEVCDENYRDDHSMPYIRPSQKVEDILRYKYTIFLTKFTDRRIGRSYWFNRKKSSDNPSGRPALNWI